MLDLMEQTPFKFISEQTRKRCNLKSQKIGVWGDYGVENHNGKLYQLISITERPHRDRKYDIGFNMTSWVIGTKAFTYSLILKGHTLKKSELKIKINKNLSTKVSKKEKKRKNFSVITQHLHQMKNTGSPCTGLNLTIYVIQITL